MTSATPNHVGYSEYIVMWFALLFLAAGLPWEWTRRDVAGQLVEASPLVSIIFLAIGGFLALQMNGRWAEMLTLIVREPLLLLLLGWVLLSFIWSADPPTTIRRTFALGITSYVGIHLALRFSQFEILRLVASVLAVVAMTNLAWIIFLPQFSGPVAGQTGAGLEFDARLTGIFSNPNPLGRVMALSVFTMLAAFRLDRRRRPFYVIALGAAIAVLLLSQSATALVATVTTSALLIVLLVFRARRTLFGAVVVAMSTIGFGSIFLAINSLGTLTAGLGRDVTLTGRIPLWEILFPEIAEAPILGRGYSAFWQGWGSPAQEIWNQVPWLPPHGHNEFLDVTLTLGFVGLFLYCALLFRTGVRATRYIRDVPHVFGLWPLTFLGFYLASTVSESDVFGRNIVWALLCSMIVLVSSKKREIDATVEEQPTSSAALDPLPQ